jgi:hypothetical protein
MVKIARNNFEERHRVAIIREFRTVPSASAVLLRGIPPSESAQCTAKTAVSRFVDRAVANKMCAEVAR